MIHPVEKPDGTHSYCISSKEVWLPGVYESKRAARYAFRFPDEELHKLQEGINDREPDIKDRYIKFSDLQELAKRRREVKNGMSELIEQIHKHLRM